MNNTNDNNGFVRETVIYGIATVEMNPQIRGDLFSRRAQFGIGEEGGKAGLDFMNKISGGLGIIPGDKGPDIREI
jgi:hypothetical protein